VDLLVTDDGAQCVFLEGVTGKDGNPLPVIVQKRDGGFNYATTDLAAIRYRFASPPAGDAAQRVIYVTDAGQANHFAGVFQVAERAGWIPAGARLEHVPFGLVQGEDGKKLKTRAGDTVRLRDLLDEAVERSEQDLRSRLQEEERTESDAFISHVATTVGLAAVKYADLSQNRLTNYQFSFDRMLALQGNTAPYLLYAVVRIAGIARKGGDLGVSNAALQFSEPQEWALVRELLKFDRVIVEVEDELLPNRLCSYLIRTQSGVQPFLRPGSCAQSGTRSVVISLGPLPTYGRYVALRFGAFGDSNAGADVMQGLPEQPQWLSKWQLGLFKTVLPDFDLKATVL
jgi:arginyl-tRNA synthetase